MTTPSQPESNLHGRGRLVVLEDFGFLNLVETVRLQRSQLAAGVQHEERRFENTLRALEPSRRVADHSSGNRFLIVAYSNREPVLIADDEVFDVHLHRIEAVGIALLRSAHKCRYVRPR